ncbi:Hypothetical protein LOCK900_2077 [Lacticaseibacillus rhamnosus LOCK900]|nr:Hypothetical protein LOCK900_2077 [Lacticaseibacillus rhamnosus LOCK900]
MAKPRQAAYTPIANRTGSSPPKKAPSSQLILVKKVQA